MDFEIFSVVPLPRATGPRKFRVSTTTTRECTLKFSLSIFFFQRWSQRDLALITYVHLVPRRKNVYSYNFFFWQRPFSCVVTKLYNAFYSVNTKLNISTVLLYIPIYICICYIYMWPECIYNNTVLIFIRVLTGKNTL